MAIDCNTKVICQSQTKQDESHMFAPPSWDTNSRWRFTFLSFSTWDKTGTENQSSVRGWCFYRQFTAQAHQELTQRFQIFKDSQVRMDMLLWNILTCLHQTGNGCWLSSCRGKTSFISPVSALHQQDRTASALSASPDHQQHRDGETFYIKDTQRQCCLLTISSLHNVATVLENVHRKDRL